MQGSWARRVLLLVSGMLPLSHVVVAYDDDALAQCRAIVGDADRLACYDAIVPAATGGAREAPAATTALRPESSAGRAGEAVPGASANVLASASAPARDAPDDALAAEPPRASDEVQSSARATDEIQQAAPATAETKAPGRVAAEAASAERAAAQTTSPERAAAEAASLARAAAETTATALPPAAASKADDFGKELLERGEDEPEQLVSRIAGDYAGWFGNTVFRLQNGQVWVQAQSGTSRYKGPPNPQVTIERRVLGSYRLKVEGSNKTVRVKRLQ